MDIFALLMNAKVVDTDDNEYSDVVAFHFVNGKLILVLRAEDEDFDDDDDPEREDIPQPTINEKIRAIAGERK